METSDHLTINCPECFEIIPSTMSALEDDNFLICPECMSEIIVDVETLLLKRETIFRKVQEHLDDSYGFEDDSKGRYKSNS